MSGCCVLGLQYGACPSEWGKRLDAALFDPAAVPISRRAAGLAGAPGWPGLAAAQSQRLKNWHTMASVLPPELQALMLDRHLTPLLQLITVRSCPSLLQRGTAPTLILSALKDLCSFDAKLQGHHPLPSLNAKMRSGLDVNCGSLQ